MFSVGIGTGSLLCERLSGHKVEIGLVPFGSIGLTLFALDLYVASPMAAQHAAASVLEFLRQLGSWRIRFDLVMIGVFGGFYGVPLYALIQSRSDPAHRSRIIACNNIMNALFMVAAAVPGDRAAEGRRDDSAAVSDHGVAERRGRGLYLHAGCRNS
ncbi:MAG: hypothetical protein ACREPK_06390 [Rhodanobacteraceae bacterium]